MNLISSLLSNLNYPTIFFLMLLESTVVPVPSEFVVTPAAYHAASGQLDVWLIILFATLGADVGASINYFVARYVGRPVVYRFANSHIGHLCLLNQEKVERSEKYFDDHGIAATLTGRFVPVIRHLISIPAGLARMNYWKFLLFTTIGAGGWHAVLAALGWYLHAIVPEDQLNDKIAEYADYIKFAILGLLVLAIIWFGVKSYLKKKKNEA
ncbi:MAG: DedA family protein [Prevotella sp.]|nr:DedA family protein [Prevotella sp.]